MYDKTDWPQYAFIYINKLLSGSVIREKEFVRLMLPQTLTYNPDLLLKVIMHESVQTNEGDLFSNIVSLQRHVHFDMFATQPYCIYTMRLIYTGKCLFVRRDLQRIKLE